jgi:uncharacterized membrane protein (UPF0127 family)
MRSLVFVAALGSCAASCAPAAQSEPSAAPKPAPAQVRAERTAPLGAVVIEALSGPQRYQVELAITPAERNRGLMFRDRLDEDAGMLFVFEDMRIQSFWMKNTRIPLDMLFIDEDFVIVGIVESTEPLTLTSRRVDKPSRYVLELAGGVSRKRGLAAGQKVMFEGVSPTLTQKVAQ